MPFEKGKTPDGAKPFPKGKSGNPNGRPKKLPELEEAIAAELNREYQIGGAKHSGLSAMMRTAVNKAIKGDARWFEAIMKYAYKTAGQAVPQDDDNQPTELVITIKGGTMLPITEEPPMPE